MDLELKSKCCEEKFYIMVKEYTDKNGRILKHTGLYCSKCHKWVKWLGKQEIDVYIFNGVDYLGTPNS